MSKPPSSKHFSFLRSLAVAMATGVCLVWSTAALPLELPKTVRIIVPFSPGGSNDLFARAIGQRLARKFNVSVIVDNRPGAGGAIGSDMVARAEPDGATLLLTSVSFATNAAVQKNLTYDPLKSFVTVAILASGPMLVTVGSSTPYRTTAQYLEAARDPRNRVNYGSAGIGSIGHMGGELLNVMAGTKWNGPNTRRGKLAFVRPGYLSVNSVGAG